MPAARDHDDEGRALAGDFGDADTHTVGFLDLPDLDTDRVMDAIVHGFSRLDDDAVLTAYCTTIDAAVMAHSCDRHGVELVHSVAHDGGTTFVLRRSVP